MPSRLGSQLSAFFFKSFIIAQRRKWPHLILLLIIQFLVILVFIKINWDDYRARRDENILLAKAGRPGFHTVDGLYTSEENKVDDLEKDEKIIVICEDKSAENLKLKQILERTAGTYLFKSDSITSTLDFDNWFMDEVPASPNDSTSESSNGKNKPKVVRPRNISFVLAIKPMFVNSNKELMYNVEIQSLYNFALPFNLLNHAFAEISAEESIGKNISASYFKRRMRYMDAFRPIYTYFIALVSSLCILITSGLFVSLCISEKEDKILMLMRLNGLTFFGYFLAQWMWYMILQTFAYGIALATFFMNPWIFYIHSHLLVIPIYFFLMSQTTISSIIASMFFKRAMVASTVCVMCVFLGLGSLGELAFHFNIWYFSFLPLFGCSITAGKLAGLSGRSIYEVIVLKEIWSGLLAAFLWNFPMYFICQYLYNVMEQGYSGTLKRWHYPITDLMQSRKEEALAKASNEKVSDESTALMDSDVRKMAEMIKGDYEQVVKTHTLVYRSVKKVYQSGNLVVDDVSIALKGNQIFGLLGPNGAGKTTLMHITAGLYEASSGSVVLEGHDSRINRQEYLSKVGFCPQHDIFWKLLTVSEHLQFFEILRGTNPKEIDDRVAKTLEVVCLSNYAKMLASNISGGERRRMSLAMALSGDSRVILLDEPTTGLDPKVRRLVWDIISESRHGRLVILTTHSMEEAELLSETITIMAHGRLKCLGTPNHLKQKFGCQVFVNFDNEHGRFQDAARGVRECCPEGTEVTIVSEGLGGVSGRLRFSGDKKQALSLMKGLLTKTANYGITSFGIIQSSLDDVFMNIVRSSDADA